MGTRAWLLIASRLLAFHPKFITSDREQIGEISFLPEAEPYQTIYPWSFQEISMSPPKMLDYAEQDEEITHPPAHEPFPRYGCSLGDPSKNGSIMLFGGLTGRRFDLETDDLYRLNVYNLSITFQQSRGAIPSPRVGHASANVDSVFVMWGGEWFDAYSDANIRDDDLYCLVPNKAEWVRIPVQGERPTGRSGHSMISFNSTIYIFGGQADGQFFDDLWQFDFCNLKGSPTWERIDTSSKRPGPSARVNHSVVSTEKGFYVFGGTDGKQHFNDIFFFDFRRQNWSLVKCRGYVPPPREGHAATLINDVMYIFGGRDIHGGDLGDLAAFHIQTKTWFMFDNIGDPPLPRSGHAMFAIGGQLYVLGGQSVANSEDLPAMGIHILDTDRLLFPTEENGAQIYPGFAL